MSGRPGSLTPAAQEVAQVVVQSISLQDQLVQLQRQYLTENPALAAALAAHPAHFNQLV